jgi:hypothetical protein
MIRRLGPAGPERPLTMEIGEVTDPAELARARARREQFDRNMAWFEAHAVEIGEKHRGKHICIAGQELFVADTVQEALALAKAAHPEDEAPFFKYIYREKGIRIYAHRGPLGAG